MRLSGLAVLLLAAVPITAFAPALGRKSGARFVNNNGNGRLAGSVGMAAAATMDAALMLELIDKWVLEDEISKPFEGDATEDACMVPIEVSWLNEKVCSLEECPATLQEDFTATYEAVAADGEGCVTVRRLKDRLVSMWSGS